MMRHPTLWPLSRDHHFTLIHAKRLREAAEPGASAELRQSALAAFRTHWPVAQDHFEAEEVYLAPHAGEALRKRLFDEHAHLRTLAEALLSSSHEDHPSPEALQALGEAIDAHVRFEEHEFFPHVEAALGEQGLATLEQAMQDLGARRDRPSGKS